MPRVKTLRRRFDAPHRNTRRQERIAASLEFRRGPLPVCMKVRHLPLRVDARISPPRAVDPRGTPEDATQCGLQLTLDGWEIFL